MNKQKELLGTHVVSQSCSEKVSTFPRKRDCSTTGFLVDIFEFFLQTSEQLI